MTAPPKPRWFQTVSWPRTKLGRLGVGGILALLVFVVLISLSSGAWGDRRFQRCILCRVVHVRHRYAGFGWESELENPCSTWYRDHVAARHEHFWVGCSTPISIQNGFGQNIGAGSNDDNVPAELLTPEEQISVYQHISDVKAATSLFLELGAQQRAHRPEALAIATSLKEWAETDQFQTPWPEWRQKMETFTIQSSDEPDGKAQMP